MSVILGSLTEVSVDGVSDGIVSVQWNIQVSMNRLWQLGDWNPYKTQVSKVLSASVNTYASALGQKTLSPSTSCADSTATMDVSVDVAACGSQGAISFNGDGMFIMSYSYSKNDPNAFGTESWSFQKWVDAGTFSNPDMLSTGAPSFVLQGRAEGSKSGNVPNLGVVLDASSTVDGSQGSVSAGFPGIGQADTITYGLVNSIGGGTLNAKGKIGQSSASIPHQPIYLGT